MATLRRAGGGGEGEGRPDACRLGVMFLSRGEIGIEALAEMMDDNARAICHAVNPCRQTCENAKSRAHDIWNQLNTVSQGGQPTSVPHQRYINFDHQYGLIKSEILNPAPYRVYLLFRARLRVAILRGQFRRIPPPHLRLEFDHLSTHDIVMFSII